MDEHPLTRQLEGVQKYLEMMDEDLKARAVASAICEINRLMHQVFILIDITTQQAMEVDDAD